MKVYLSPFADSFSLQACQINLFQYLESGGGWSVDQERRIREAGMRTKLLDTCLNSSEGTGGVGSRGSRVGCTGKAFGFVLSIPSWLTWDSAPEDTHFVPDRPEKGRIHCLSQEPCGGFVRLAVRPAAGKTSDRQDYEVGTVAFLSPGSPCCAFLLIPWSGLIQMPGAKNPLSQRALMALG